jgi:hypothetical protein
MDPDFAKRIESLEPKLQALVRMKPVTYTTLPRTMPACGIYLFSEGIEHLYIGRTNRMRQRLRGHCVMSANHYSATFAFRIARRTTGRTQASYTKAGSRPELLNDAAFGLAFRDAKCRIALMDLRYVEELDSTCQALLEIYTATVLKTRYNDFENH